MTSVTRGYALTALADRLFRRSDATSLLAVRMPVERLLSNARLFLAVASLVAVYLDPDEPTLLVPLAYSILIFYALFAVLVFALLRAAPEAVLARRIVVHGCDIAAAAVITVLTQGSSSPFFVFFIFVLLASALRWGVAHATRHDRGASQTGGIRTVSRRRLVS